MKTTLIALALSCVCMAALADGRTAKVSAPGTLGPLAFAAGEIESALKRGNDVVTIITDKEVSLSAKFTCPHDGFSFPEIEPRLFSFNSPYGACPECHGLGTKDLWSEEVCPLCLGKRIREESLNVLIDGKNINTTTALAIEEAYKFFGGLKFKNESLN